MTPEATLAPSACPDSAELAARPFDALGLTYEQTYVHLPAQRAAIDWLIARLPARAKVLDIGSGTGRPTADLLARAGHLVTGIDVSATMVDLARSQVPAARFEQADVRTAGYPKGSWDAVCAFFPLLQMSRADLDRTLERIADWLAPGGYFVFATVPFDAENHPMTWMGHRLTATSYPVEVYLERLRAAGLEILHHQLSVFHPDFPGMGAEEHFFVHARKPGGPTVPAHALAAPYPHPEEYRGPHELTQHGWLAVEARFEREDIDPVVEALARNERVVDVGGGSGAVVRAITRRLGACTTIEPHAARVESMQALCTDGVTVLPGCAEQLPLADASVDAAVATWMLHYADDPQAAVAELARVVDPAHPEAKVVLVQGSPDNELIDLWNRVCAPLTGEQPDHQGQLLTLAARTLAEHGFQDIALHPVAVRVAFPEPGPHAKAEAAADALADFWHTGHAQRDQLRAALLAPLAEHFATGADSISDNGVMLVARPRRSL
ncbi:SAM-dependent methyltransferase [Kitasatospora sp. MAA4]|uniref:class I SAM-dependent methyltransferase n=1 Tax=Kitasatospora sp. MAA4 TaxID=3035093 RepID=UPI002476A0C5|nr:class I SAM-dependent methyltransferase [Kitasatospora sp. MAA4]MDH6133396.1 SAM-dependent methyltransferase [Kitasatospora sp. MAA4]